MDTTTNVTEASAAPDSPKEKAEAKTSKTTGKILKLLFILALILAVFFIGAKYGEDIWDKISGDKDETSSLSTDDDDEVADTEDEVVAEGDAEEEGCTQTYTNARFTDLSFDYDSCYWTLVSTDSTDVITEVTLTNSATDELKFHIQAVGLFDGFGTCEGFGYEIIGPDLRSRMLEGMSGLKYFYVSEVYEMGTAAYEDTVLFLGEPEVEFETTAYDYCYSTLSFVTPSNIAFPAEIDPGTGETMLSIMSVNLTLDETASDANAVAKADEVVETLEY